MISFYFRTREKQKQSVFDLYPGSSKNENDCFL
jgi:hypothetical protein